MRLTQIKLSGFKSFVDATTVILPGSLSAVVGPNGCGKSNVIDAVRWVMGESSARQIRGETSTDVIFNGSAGRKPTVSASVELLFDNTDGRVGGQYAAYAEIAIRREVNRDPKSTYFLNGIKCRRRDIQDVFLGTGFGPRSYSIIEQGMISQLVEAKPDELRGYLEEAAGISKYRERRRETENMIKHTSENLARLRDIREELGKQLDRLQRQAKAAERYRELKEEESKTAAELYTLRHIALAGELAELNRKIQQSRVELEAANTEYRRIETEIDTVRAEHADQSEAFNRVQGRFYQLGSEISRAEETIDFSTRRASQLELDLEGVTRRVEEMQGQLAADEQLLEALGAELGDQTPRVEAAQAVERQAQLKLEEVERTHREVLRRAEEINQRFNENSRQLDVQRSRIEHFQQLLERQSRRRESLALDLAGIVDLPQQESEELQAAIVGLDAEKENVDGAAEESRLGLVDARDALRQTEKTLEGARANAQSLRQDLASLEAVQAAALGRDKSRHEAWLVGQGLSGRSRIGESLAVVNGWERALETVLGAFLHGVVVDDLDQYAVAIGVDAASDLALIEKTAAAETSAESRLAQDLPLLESLLRNQGDNLGSLLGGVFAAESLEVAMGCRRRLAAHESIITRDGVWVGSDWITVAPEADAQSGVIQRGQEIEILSLKVEESEGALGVLEAGLLEHRERISQLEGERELLQRQSAVLSGTLSERRSEARVREVQQQEAERRRARIQAELDELGAQTTDESQRLLAAQETMVAVESRRTEINIQRDDVLTERQKIEERIAEARQSARQARDAYHGVNADLAALRSRHDAAETARSRMQQQLKDLALQSDTLRSGIEQSRQPIPELRRGLEEKLTLRTEVEGELKTIRLALEELDSTVRTLETARHGAEARISTLRETLEEARIGHEGLVVTEKNILEKIASTGRELETVRANMPEEANQSVWQENLDAIQRRIERLGAINLAAIDEFRTESERKAYLDAQNEDLEQALATLREAMRKIDRETRVRFKETFETVNKKLGELFPKVFGGGHAYLELTGEDWLDTGVTLMARPPGKRNTSVHLLSGGEKAMTAISLIFAIFHLNPSPVCLLDEVDAPLDDANVGRYAELIREMSSEVQFIVITHNKITMEAADHLMGVTMNEPGVSRLVSVDVGEAVALAAV
ncbi:MAG: chromosome segregation protein SMC [Gammaproteobacteria bacterium]|nr:chromosome segregation protein SMC [Gammaproteobacteria bacterium]